MTIKAHARTFTLWTGSLLSLLIADGFGEPVRAGGNGYNAVMLGVVT